MLILIKFLCFLGDGGVGKSSALAALSLDWADDVEHLRHIDLLFLVQLRHVSDNIPLSDIIAEQHGLSKIVSGSEIDSLLHGQTDKSANIILLLDGYDEYTKGTNTEIDKLLEEVMLNILCVFTSRPGNFLKPLENQVDGELVITGFSKENTKRFVELYLGPESWEDFMQQARTSGIIELLSIPIIVRMTCFLYSGNHSLPDNRTDLFQEVVYKTIDRTLLKSKTEFSRDRIDVLLTMLGELSWKALQKSSKQLLINKVW